MHRVAFRLLHEIHEKFTRAVPVALWSSVAPVGNSSCAAQIHFKDDLALLLRRFQDARKADTLTAVMEKSEQTQKEVKRTIDAVLQNGESLDELVQKSQDLSRKTHFATSKSQKAAASSCVASRECDKFIELFSSWGTSNFTSLHADV
ncbi:putative prenylated protein [Toxoplasma gondii p89]|uniref:Putative prenylated protein n=1 Tax=Toxoplasma gondii p89 TaxID=943119 RepID=A0A086KQ71_TOXGO|nr:putative prenylated protein [Toxoplasma gondii p89]